MKDACRSLAMLHEAVLNHHLESVRPFPTDEVSPLDDRRLDLMKPQTANIVSVVRPMKGNSHAQLVQASDGRFYVAKFTNGPQGVSHLAREMVNAAIFRLLDLSVPDSAILRLDARSFAGTSWPTIVGLHGRREPIQEGLHFGSCFPGNPATDVAYDFVPDHLAKVISNLASVREAVFADSWLGATHARQVVFARDHGRSLYALCIDHGDSFWTPTAIHKPMQFLSTLGSQTEMGAAFLSVFEKIRLLPAALIRWAFGLPPRDWLYQCESEIARGRESLIQSRSSFVFRGIHSFSARPGPEYETQPEDDTAAARFPIMADRG